MRVALCLSGMVRTLEQTFPNLKNAILQPLNPDVFVSTYDCAGNPAEHDFKVEAEFFHPFFKPTAVHIAALAEMDPIFFKERDRLYAVPGPIWSPGSVPESRFKLKNTLSMLWHVRECDRLRQAHEAKTGQPYDLVIRARMDSLFYEPLTPSLGHLFLPNHAAYGGACDQFAIGSSSGMAAYSDTYTHFEDIWRSRVLMPDFWGVPENLLKRYLVLHEIPYQTFSFPFDLQRPGKIEPIRHHTEEWFCDRYSH